MTRTVVLCGSLGATAATWNAQKPVLEQAGFRVVAVDHPGHGGAPVIDFDDVGDLARAVARQLDEERFSFVGLSLGGAVGMTLALELPRRIQKLVLACTSMRFGEPPFWQERAATVRREGLEAVVDVVLERWFTPEFENVPPYREMFLSTDREGYARCCEALARWDVRARLSAIDAPTLCIAGDDDPSTPPAELEAIAAAVPDARLVVLHGAGHLANVERADEFNAALLPFL